MQQIPKQPLKRKPWKKGKNPLEAELEESDEDNGIDVRPFIPNESPQYKNR